MRDASRFLRFCLDVALPIGIEHVRMAMLLEQIQDRVESFLQLEIALRRGQRDNPEKVDSVSTQSQVFRQGLVFRDNRRHKQERVQLSASQNGAGGFPFGMVWPCPSQDLLS